MYWAMVLRRPPSWRGADVGPRSTAFGLRNRDARGRFLGWGAVHPDAKVRRGSQGAPLPSLPHTVAGLHIAFGTRPRVTDLCRANASPAPLAHLRHALFNRTLNPRGRDGAQGSY